MKECAPLSDPQADGFVTAAQWGVEYNYCRLQHKVLVHCVEDHEKKR